MKQVYKVALSEEEEAELQALISKGKTAARKMTRARILLLAHTGEKDTAIARALQTSVSTVERTRKNLVLEGLKAALEEALRPGAKPKLDAKGHGFLVALACSTPPLGREGWTLELLSDRHWSPWATWRASPRRPCAVRSKKRTEALVAPAMGDPDAGSRVRLAHGRGHQPLHRRRRA